ncbi:MAG: DUF624 domain-containing protein [Firmicutes bacterium]|nr:DUF624 domain-containing protein [Bacillota bacterium]
MRDIFSLDGPFNKYGGYLADTIILSLLWIFFSIPIVTIGASTTAMFYVSTRRIAEREGYITSDFWVAFKANFKKATILWMLILVFVLIMIFNIMNIEIAGAMATFMLSAQYVFLLLIAFISVYLFPMTARFEMGIKQIIKSSFYMSIRHIFTTVTCVVMLLGLVIIVTDFINILFFAAPGAYAMGSSYMIMRVFKKYRPEMDKDPRIEIQEIEAQKAEERRSRGIHTMDDEYEDDIGNE